MSEGRVRERVVSPGQEDPFVAGLAQAIGGPRGAHAVRESSVRGGRFWTAARIVLALTCLTLVFHWVQKSPCRDGGWVDFKQYTNFCYTDVLALYGAEGLNQGKVPYVPERPIADEHQVEYPVLTGAFMGLIGLPIHAIGQNMPELNQYQAFYDVNALALSAFAVATVAMILSIRRRRPWDAALFALSPALLVTATVNWDFLAIVLAMAGIWFWAKQRPLLAGVLLGLGTAAKLWPGFLLGAVLIVSIRHAPDFVRSAMPGSATLLRKVMWALDEASRWLWRFRALVLATIGAVVAWVVVNVPVMLISMHDWSKFIRLNTERGIDWGTFWYVGRYFDTEIFRGVMPDGFWGNTPLISNLAHVLFAAGCLGVLVLGMRAPVPPRFAQLAFLIVALFLVTSKVWSQQFNLWLLPLLVLARPKWGAFLFWQIAEVCYFLAFYGELLGASGQPVIPEGTFILASVLRLAAVATLIALVVRDILYPEADVVRRTYGGDPDSGFYSLKMTASGLSSRVMPKASLGAVSAAS